MRTGFIVCIAVAISFAIGLLIGVSVGPNSDVNRSSPSATLAGATFGSSSSSSPTTPAGARASPPKPPQQKGKPGGNDGIKKRFKNAFVGFMDQTPNSGDELRWMYFSAYGSGVPGDIIMMGHPRVGRYVPPFCSILRGPAVTLENAREALQSHRCPAPGETNSVAFPPPPPPTVPIAEATKIVIVNDGGVSNSTSPTATPPSTAAPVMTTTPPRDDCTVRCLIIVNEHDDQDAIRLHYPYLRSLYFPTNPVLRQLLEEDYDYILKTDLDIFFTPVFNHMKVRPGKLFVGKGKYVFFDSVRKMLKRIAAELKMTHRGIHNVGATWYGDSKLVLELTELAHNVTVYIIRTEFKSGNDKGKWAERWWGVSSMYAGEIVINDRAPAFTPGYLDAPCTNRFGTCIGGVIHAWHEHDVFSKFAYRGYNKQVVLERAIAPEKKGLQWLGLAGNYASYIALASMDMARPPFVWGDGVCAMTRKKHSWD